MNDTPCEAPAFDGTQPCRQVDPEAFFPEKGGSVRLAKKICRSCEFVTACLEFALANDLLGVWGGTSEKQRRGMDKPERKPEQQPIKHGTEGGYAQHYRRKQLPVCQPCREADKLVRRERAERRAERAA